MREIKTERTIKFTCDKCNLREETTKDKPQGWIIVQESNAHNVRLFEAPRQVAYEAFHVPHRVDRTYCSQECALASWTESLKLFIAEMRNIKAPERARPINQ